MELTAAIGLIGALLVPFLVALFVAPEQSPSRKRNTTLAVCIIVGIGVGLGTGQIETTDTIKGWATRVLIGLGVVTGLTNGFYKALKDPVDALSAATSPGTSTEPVLPDEEQGDQT